ncbi:Plant lipid transfer protein/Par allergen [Macleaya cordata]|uniref:Non-specific lipid-transfer protein n=1 Tax=Macleaya cordata TaxID=56857 RepID=A0A200R3K8_MACCD|nr:Plant lipid transfer protein/Par allergen [Macleaya cordata]
MAAAANSSSSSSSSVVFKMVCVVLACMVVAAPYAAEGALSCGTVASKLAPCINYLKVGGALPKTCCDGVKGLKAAAQTPADRKTACGCLKSAASGIAGINLGLAGSLPGKCGVSIPYKISPSTDCSKYISYVY